MKLSIAVVSNRSHNPMFVGSLYALTQHLSRQEPSYGVVAHSVSIGTGHSCLSMGRQQLLNSAIAQGYTHLLFIDDDMVFSPDIVKMMLRHKVAVIGANAVTKSSTPRYVAKDLNGRELKSRGKSGIEEISRIGMGIMLIDLAAIQHIEAPHFEVKWDRNGYISEDNYFCDKLRTNGIKIYVDHDASLTVGHVGDHVYTWKQASHS